MNYQRIYDLLILRARNRTKPNIYCEKHHILPECMNGEDTPENLIWLTAREHYIAHQLLMKLYPDVEKLTFAANYMTIDRWGKRIGNRKYEWLKIRFSEAMSSFWKTKWKDPAHIKTMQDVVQNPDRNRRISEAKTIHWKNPNYYWNQEEKRTAHSEFMRQWYADNEQVRSKIGERTRNSWKNPNSTYNQKEYREAIGKSLKQTWRCLECGFENNAGNVGKHQKKMNHNGKERI